MYLFAVKSLNVKYTLTFFLCVVFHILLFQSIALSYGQEIGHTTVKYVTSVILPFSTSLQIRDLLRSFKPFGHFCAAVQLPHEDHSVNLRLNCEHFSCDLFAHTLMTQNHSLKKLCYVYAGHVRRLPSD